MEQENERFQIEMTPQKELMREGYRIMIWHSWRAVVYSILAALCMWQTGRYFNLAFYWNGQGWDEAFGYYLPDALYFLALTAATLALFFFMPALSARRYMKRLASVFGDPAALTVSYRFGEDALHSQDSSGQKIDTAYDQYVSVWETAHCIVLRRKMSVFHVLDKSKIRGGVLGDFKAFLQEKMPQAKFHWKTDA